MTKKKMIGTKIPTPASTISGDAMSDCRSLTPVSFSPNDVMNRLEPTAAQSALNARKVVENTLTAVAVELLCGAQAMEFVDDFAPGTGTGAAYETIREDVPPLSSDRPLHTEIETVAETIASGTLEAEIERALGESIE